MSRNVRQNNFIEGTMIAYIAIVVTKILGAVYSIPFYQIIGEDGGFIYSCAYNIYAIFLEISISGIPVALSIQISEYNARGLYDTKEHTYRIARKIVVGLGLFSFALIQIFSYQIAGFFVADMTEGVTIDDVALGMRMISYCLLIVPCLALRRGYFQGHKILTPSSFSEVIEQLVRIAIVLGGSYCAINILQAGKPAGVSIALLGAAIGALAAYVYMQITYARNRSLFQHEEHEEIQVESREIVKKLISYGFTIVIVSIANNIYSTVDMKMLLVGLRNIGFGDIDTQTIASVSSTWVPKICMIVMALSMGLSRSLAPHAAESNAVGDFSGINKNLNTSIKTLILISLPMSVGITMCAEPLYNIFYGASPYGGTILGTAVYVYVFAAIAGVMAMLLQSVGAGRVVCISTILGILINLGMDLPLIYLFNNLGLPAYVGASASSILGQTINITIMSVYIKKKYYFKYTEVWSMIPKTLAGLVVMMGVVFGIQWLWPMTNGRTFLTLVQLLVIAIAGAGVYFLITYKLHAIQDVFGEDILKKVIRKIKRR